MPGDGSVPGAITPRAVTPRVITPWPSLVDYQDALQSPAHCLSDPELADGVIETTTGGFPRPIAGRFATVYRLTHPTSGQIYAVRCLNKRFAERARRYQALQEHLTRLGDAKPSAFVVPEYQETGIRIGASGYPIVKMPWVEGDPLNVWVERQINDAARLTDLLTRFHQLADALRKAKIAHGDLQHGNILVTSANDLRLVDYDGIWVPALTGRGSCETGHSSYQHPRRIGNDFGRKMDRFSLLVITTALRALIVAPELWYRLDNRDNLLFTQVDFADPARSRAFSLIENLHGRQRDPELLRRLQTLRAACAAPPAAAFPLDSV